MPPVAAPARPAAPTAPPRAAPPRTLARLDPLLAGVAACLVAGWHVGVPALWRDEAASVGAAERTWSALAGMLRNVDAVHGLYYAFLHLWFGLVGFTPFTLRLPSVLAAGGTAAVVALLGARLGSRRTGLAAGFSAAVLPSLVWAGGEGRSYAISALLASVATLALLHALGPHRSRRAEAIAWVAHAALLAFTAAVFLDGLLLAAAHVVTVALVARGWRRAAGIPSAVAAALLVAPLIRRASHQGEQVSWIQQVAPPTPWHQVLVEQWFRSGHVAWLALALVVIGAVVAVVRGRIPRTGLAVAIPWAVLPTVLLLASGLVHQALYWPRYMTFSAPAVALLLGLAAAALPRLLGAVAVVALAALATPQIVADREPRAKAKSEMALAAALVAAERRPADGPSGIVYGQYDDVVGATTRIEQIAYPADFRGLVDLRAITPLTDSTVLFGANRSVSATVPRMQGLRTVWFLFDADGEPRTYVPVTRMQAAGFHQTGTFFTSGSRLLRWSR